MLRGGRTVGPQVAKGVGAALVLIVVVSQWRAELGAKRRKLRGSEVLLAECGRGGLVSLDCSVAVVLVTGVCQYHCDQAGQGGDGV